MGKTLALTSTIERYARLATAKIRSWTRFLRPRRDSASSSVSVPSSSREGSVMERGGGNEQEVRVPLSEVVADCVRRWFNEALKEARAGDTAMQVLVGQMYHSGYGVPKNDQKARVWIEKASRYRSSVWKVSDKRPVFLLVSLASPSICVDI
ncbi:sel1 repeat protein isoform X2 [Carex rostrata]